MTCRDFDRACNDWLDLRSTADGPIAPALEDHAAACPACRGRLSAYQALHLAIAALGPPPAAPPGLADRVLAATPGRDRPRILTFPLRSALPWAVAAVVLLAAGLALRAGRGRVEVVAHDPPTDPPAARRPLGEALSDATSASLELARAASAPAARIGRGAIAAAEFPEPAWPIADGPDLGPPGKSVGDRVGEGLRPLSGSARQAFGFLLAPLPAAKGPEPDTGA